MNTPRCILVPVDLGAQSDEVLDHAAALAAKLDAKIHLLHVLGRPLLGGEVSIAVAETTMDEIQDQCQQTLDRLVAARAADASFGPTLLRAGDARTVIQQTAEELHADLIVMGTHGRRGVSRLVLGSVAESVVRTCRCPVLLIRDRAEVGDRAAPQPGSSESAPGSTPVSRRAGSREPRETDHPLE